MGRYLLADLVEERHGCSVWRAEDGTLNREVLVWLVPLDLDVVPELEEVTRIAATIDDRRIVRIMDVFRTDDHLVVVTEWVREAILRDHLAEPMAPTDAARIAYEVARGIESAHASGIAHGRIRPSNVLVGPDGEIRLTGLGIDAVIEGIDPVADGDPVTADVHGIGSILYVCLTGRWPDPRLEEMPSAPEVGGHIPPPSRILADVPESLDDVCARTVVDVVPPRGRPVLTSASQVRALLGSSLTDLTVPRRSRARTRRSGDRVLPQLGVTLAVILAMLALGWLTWWLVADRTSGTDPEPVASATPTASPSAGETASARPEPVTYRIAAARDFDPLGSGEENPGRVPAAYDGDPNTAWRTVTYYDKGLDNKPGVGLLLDLGAPRSVGKVTLELVGNGSDLQVLTSNEEGAGPQDYDLMAQATEAGETVTLKGPNPPSARYILIWMTGLPQVDGGWRGGVREVTVTS